MSQSSGLPVYITDKDRLEKISKYRSIGSKREPLLDKIVAAPGVDFRKIVVEMLGTMALSEIGDLMREPALPSFSLIERDNFTSDFQPISAFEKAAQEKSGLELGIYFQVNRPGANGPCELAGIAGFGYMEDELKLITSVVYISEPFSHCASEDDIDTVVRHAVANYTIVQYLMKNRAVEFRESISRQSVPKSHPHKGKQRELRTRMVKTIYVNSSDIEQVKRNIETRTMSCPCWGVAGHWRNYRSGKKVWIKPYRKGKKRNDPTAYCPKSYLQEEALCN